MTDIATDKDQRFLIFYDGIPQLPGQIALH
jgi:hypothetical protein